jgi:hypothetical protein
VPRPWRLSIHVRKRVVAAPRKYPDELLWINPETSRNWVTRAEIDEGHRPGTTTDDGIRTRPLIAPGLV